MTESFPRQDARTRRFTLGVPRAFRVSPDGARVAFLRTQGGGDPVTCLWVLDVDDGTERLVADPRTLGGPAQENGAEADLPPELLEVMLLSDLQKVEHFEIAAYGSARPHAQALGLQEAADLLEETLNEEKETDTLLNKLALEEINPQAVSEDEEGEQESGQQRGGQSRGGSRKSG